MARIGVAPSLTNVKQAISEMGHEVVDLRSEEDAARCDCCVISGSDKDMMGIADTFSSGAVINAQGATTDEVCDMIHERLQ